MATMMSKEKAGNPGKTHPDRKSDEKTEDPSVGTDRKSFKGELQRQNKLILSERPFKILQNETKIIKIGHAVLEIFNFKD